MRWLQSPRGLSPTGSAAQLVVPLVPVIALAVWAGERWPQQWLFPTRPNLVFQALGWLWLAFGVGFWGATLASFLPRFRRGELITRGPYALSRHPLFALFPCFFLPALGLFAENRALFAAALVAWPLAQRAGAREDAELQRVFGAAWTDYAARTPALLPLSAASARRRLGQCAWAAAAACVLYTGLLRPWILGWGASVSEQTAALAGDDFVPQPRFRSTRAIDVAASAEQIWPWLVQLGWGKGGLYSYAWLENLFGCQMYNAEQILPEHQALAVGDAFYLDRRVPAFRVGVLEPLRALVVHAGGQTPQAPAVAWQFVLEPRGAARTRLLVRLQSSLPPGLAAELFGKTLLEPVHFIMEERMLRGIRERAERTHVERARGSLEVSASCAGASPPR